MQLYILPDELLLEIASHFHGHYQNTNLLNFALVCRRFRPIAQEALLCNPCFNLTYIHYFLWQIAHHPHLIPKIRRLELWSSNEGRLPPESWHSSIIGIPRNLPRTYPAVPCPRDILKGKFFSQCYAIFSFYAKELEDRLKWASAVREDVIPALLGVLLLALPNLKELKCAASWLMDFPIFSQCHGAQVWFACPPGWRHGYLCCVLEVLQKRLEVLEFPTNIVHMAFLIRPISLFDFRSFANLKELSVPMCIICYSQHSWGPPADPENIFPPTLELLRISEASERTANFLNNLCVAKKKSRFPSLRRIEIYYYTVRHEIAALADKNHCPDPLFDVQRMCTDAGLALLIYFPGTMLRTSLAGRSLWSLREEGVLLDVEGEVWRKRMGYFGQPEQRYDQCVLEVDEGGDVEMG